MPPRLSIVVPVYNVELYLDECLESIAAQTFDDFEVVLVDDGSTDDSAAMAQAFADRDARFRVVLQENAGLGAARNVGARHVTPGTEYLAFVDSDDTMPEHAYQRMIDALDETGSDFAAGNVKRFRSVGMSQSWGHRAAFAHTKLKTHISKFPALVTDRTAWNKVYRRSFWDEHGFQYPEGILYEDAPVSIPAHYFATSVDILGDCVYHWRVRETGERSITQRSTDPVSVIDRVASVRLVREALQRKQGAPYARFLREYDRNVLSEELPLIYKYVAEAGPDFRAAFSKEVGGLVREIGTGPWPDLTVADRLKAYLAGEGRIEEFINLLRHQRDFTYSVPVKGLARPQADYPFLKAPVPSKVLTLGPRERRVVSRLEQALWSDGKLLLRGYALPGHLGAESRLGSRKALIFRESGKRRTVIGTRTVASPMATVNSPHLALRHADWAGFTAVVDPTAFQTGGKWSEGVWTTSVVVTGAGGLHRSRLRGGEHDSGQNPPAHWVTPDVRVVPNTIGAFTIQVEVVRARALDVRASGDDAIEVAGELAAEVGAGGALRAEHVSTGAVLTFPLEASAAVAGGRIPFTARVPLAELAAVPDAPYEPGERTPEPWSLSVTGADGAEHRLAHDERAGFAGLVVPLPGEASDRFLFAKRGNTGHLTLSVQASPPLLDTVEAKDGTLTLRGRFVAPVDEPYELVLHDAHGVEFNYPVTRDGDRFEAVFEPVLAEAYAGRTPLPQGRWWPTLRPVSRGGVTAGLLGVDRGAPVQFAPTALHAGPQAVTARGRRIRVEARLYDRMVLVADPLISPHDRSRYAQRVARDVTYPAQRALPVKDIVVYDSFQGNGAGDSPRAIHEELVRRGVELEHVWLVRDGRAEVPATARAVQYDSLESWDVLARARYYVVNDSVPLAFRRRPGQTVVQTWHGTPLKQIGHDFMHDYYTSPEVLEALEHDSAQWSLLASPGSYATPVLKRALGYDGEVVESGSARTDALLKPDAARIAEIRRRLGLPEGKKVVLYMPTWRENRLGWSLASGYRLDLQIDVDAARRELGEDHVLLVRGHHKVNEQLRDGVRDGFVRDVSRWADPTDLLLVADVLISDYSSVIFDYAHTDKPILLFTYDLEHYRDTLRGFTFDFEKKAPGPLLRDSASLIEAVRNADAVGAQYARARAEFRAEFCDLDDGGAAERIVDRMLGM